MDVAGTKFAEEADVEQKGFLFLYWLYRISEEVLKDSVVMNEDFYRSGLPALLWIL
jgi:hypothetical protein